MSHGDNIRPNASQPTAHPLVGIVVALPEELATLTSQKLVRGACVAISENIVLAYAGAGSSNAEHAAQHLISLGANHLISWGCAGALSPQLKPGDLVVADRVISEQSSTFDTNTAWSHHVLNLLATTLSMTLDGMAESKHIVATSIEKQTIHRQTEAVALDMESGAVVRAAYNAGLPSLVIRAIADPVDMDLPQAVVQSLNNQGEVELKKLLRFLLTHPGEIPSLIKLGLHFNAAQKTLKTVARRLNEIIHF